VTGAQTSLLAATASEEREAEADKRDRDDDPTPRGVVRAVLEAAISGRESPYAWMLAQNRIEWKLMGQSRPLRVLDVGAGYGAWSSEMRRLARAQGWPVHITGVEIHAARAKYLRKWCDDVVISDWRDVLRVPEQFDLAIGNPPFGQLTGPKHAKRPPEQCMPNVLLRHAPAVMLLHTQQACLKSEAGRASYRAAPPAATWLLPGGIRFRSGTNPRCSRCKHENDSGAELCSECGAKLKPWSADSRCYQVTLWLRGHSGPCSTYLLDDLDASERAWVVPPGTEECEACAGSGEAGTAEWLEWHDSGGGLLNSTPTHCKACRGSGVPHDLPTAPGWTP
jgi:SAM-dependent methyltransferase